MTAHETVSRRTYSPVLCALLGEHGIDCLSTQAAGNLGLSDNEQLVFAGREQRTILTFDLKNYTL